VIQRVDPTFLPVRFHPGLPVVGERKGLAFGSVGNQSLVGLMEVAGVAAKGRPDGIHRRPLPNPVPVIESVPGDQLRSGQPAPIFLRDFRKVLPDVVADCGCQPNRPLLLASQAAALVLVVPRSKLRLRDAHVSCRRLSPRSHGLSEFSVIGTNKSMRYFDAGKVRYSDTPSRSVDDNRCDN
jgi:hypothetical protein